MKRQLFRPPILDGPYETSLRNSWRRAKTGELYATLPRLQYNPRLQRIVQDIIEERR